MSNMSRNNGNSYSNFENSPRDPLMTNTQDATHTQERLINILDQIQTTKNEIVNMKRDVRELRVTAASELVELSVLYDPTIRGCLAETKKAAEEAKKVVQDGPVTFKDLFNKPIN